MLDKQTAIELAEGLGLDFGYYNSGHPYIRTEYCYLKDACEYFDIERMALLALEHDFTIASNAFLVRVDGDIPILVKHNGSIEDKQRAYCQAVAKVLIEIKGSGE